MKKIVSILLALLMIVTCIPMSIFSTFAISVSEMPSNIVLTSGAKYNISPGVTEEHITTVDSVGDNQNKSYVSVLDFKSGQVSAMAGYKDNDSSGKWGMQTVRDQAKKAEAATGRNIVVAINGDYYNMSTGEPLNNLVMNGKIVHQTSDPNSWYFAILKDGTPAIRQSTVPLDDVQEAVGSPLPLVTGGEVRSELGYGDVSYDPNHMPRNAIGLTADGKVVVLLNDGRQAPKSVGYTLYELAKMMKAYGCVDAIYLDGGGSATYASKSEGTNVLTVKNSPSDGTERLVSSSIFFYSTAVDTAEFDHASLTPNNEVYTPNSTVVFSAIGVNSVGAPAELPEDGKFVLADETYGTISEDGIFTSNGATGTVVVNYVSNNEIKGTTSIEIQAPDSISFSMDEVSLGFNASSNLGMIVKYRNREINYNENDIEWVMSDASMGSFEGLIFTSSDSATVTGTITAKSKYDESVSATVTAVIGRLPSVVLDFEDHVNEDESVTPASDYWSITHGGVLDPSGGSLLNRDAVDQSARLVSATYGRGCNTTAEIVDFDNGEVRFGSHALKINYDFTGYIAGTEGANVGLMEATQQIEGSPTGIGVWVYAPEKSANLWLRLRVKDGTGTVQTVNFTGTEGVNWTGWKYLEADISNLKGPFSLIGGETIRCLYLTSAGGSGQKTLQDGQMVDLAKPDQKGCLYFDNIQFVYGANTDDTDNPVINSMQANLNEISNDMVLDTNKVSFRISYSDVINKNSTGVNPDSLAVYIDGKDMTDSCVVQAGDEMIYLDDLMLVNGTHSVKVRVRDNFNNETTETRNFIVNGPENFNTITIVPSETAELGKKFNLQLSAIDVSEIKSMSVNLKIDSAFADGYTYEFADGFDGTCVYDAKTSSFEVSATQNESFSQADSIVNFTFNIPSGIAEGKSFSYSANNGSFEAEGDYQKTFSFKNNSIVVIAPICVEVGTMIVGAEKGTIKVTYADGYAVDNAAVYLNDSAEPIGYTDRNGVVETSLLNSEAKSYSVYAMAGKNVSFKVYGQSYPSAPVASNAPEYISISATTDSETTKNITWLSNPVLADKDAVIRYAEKSLYEEKGDEAFVQLNADTAVYTFNGKTNVNENYAVNINSCMLENLKRDTEYVYVVANGDVCSAVKSFKTSVNGESTHFFVIGDTQTEDKTNQNKIFETLAYSGVDYNFGIQTGDSIESANVYSDWLDNLELYSGDYMSTVDIIHVLGNHEYMGDEEAQAAKTIYNIPSTEVYSAQYGNVYVATMGYTTNREKIAERLEWIKQDSANSSAQWKILTIHQPPFYTNGLAPSEEMNELVPPAMEEAGFDFVFSGHDHTYTRTNDINGTTYYICGTTGGKAYGFTNDKFEYAFKTDDYDNAGYSGIYLDCSADSSKMTVTARYANGDIIDEYTKTKEICANGIHTFIYSADNYLSCSVCGYTVKAADSKYTGIVHDEATGLPMSLAAGSPRANTWFTNGDDYYYLGADGKAVTGTHTLAARDDALGNAVAEYTFDNTGKNISGSFVKETVTNPDTGESKEITRYYLGGDYLRRWNEIDGKLYFFHRTNNVVWQEGYMYTGEKNVSSANLVKRKFLFDENGALLRGAFDDVTDIDGKYIGTRYYWGDEYVTDDVTVDGFTYSFDDDGFIIPSDFSKCTITLSATKANYTGKAIKPTVTVADGSLTLTNKHHYKVEYKNNTNVGTASVIISGYRGYAGSVTKTFKINPVAPTGVTAKTADSGQVKVSWNAVKDASSYTVMCAESGGTMKAIATVKTNSFVDTTATIGQKYDYSVKATVSVSSKDYTSVQSAKVSVTPVLAGAKLNTITASSYNTIKLSWAKTDKATGYYVYRATSKTGKYTKLATVTATSYTDSKATTGTTYYYKIVPYVTTDSGTFSGAESAVLSAKATLKKISDLKATVSDKVALKWTAVPGATGYYVYRATSKTGKYTKLTTVTGASYTDSKANIGTTYYYKVTPYIKVSSGNVSGSESNIVSAKPLLKQVSGLKATPSHNKIALKWTAVPGATGYAVYRATSKDGKYTKLADSKTNSYTDSGAKWGTKYYYKVRAFVKVNGSAVYGAYSSIISAKTTLATPSAKVTASGKTATVKWSKIAGANGYVVYRATSKTGSLTKVKTITSASTVSFKDSSLKSGNTYYYVVKAYKTVGNTKAYSAESSRVSIKIK